MSNEITAVVFSFIKTEFVDKATRIYQNAVDNYSYLKGCTEIKILKKMSSPNEFMVVSKWESLEARNEYLKSEFHLKAVEQLKPLRMKEPIMSNYELVTVKREE